MADFPIKDEIFSSTFWQGLCWFLITCMAPLITFFYDFKFKLLTKIEEIEKMFIEMKGIIAVVDAKVETKDTSAPTLTHKDFSASIDKLESVINTMSNDIKNIFEKTKEIDADITNLKHRIYLGPDQPTTNGTSSIRNKTDIDVDADKVRDILAELKKMTQGR